MSAIQFCDLLGFNNKCITKWLCTENEMSEMKFPMIQKNCHVRPNIEDQIKSSIFCWFELHFMLHNEVEEKSSIQ